MARRSRIEDAVLTGGVSSQNMETNFNVLSSGLMHQDRFSRLYHGSSAEVPSRAECVPSFRPESTMGMIDGQAYGTLVGRDNFLAVPAREFDSSNSAVLPLVNKNEGVANETQRFSNGSSHISNAISTSPRVLSWAGSEQPGELGSEADYRELDVGDGGSSNGSQCDGSDEDDEDDGDVDGEGKDINIHQESTQLAEHRLSSPKSCETSGCLQSKGEECTKQDLVAGLQSSESLQKSSFDRELSLHPSASCAPPVSTFLSPSSAIPFMNSYSSTVSAGPILGQADSNTAAPDSMPANASGLDVSNVSHRYFRENIEKEATSEDHQDTEKILYSNEQAKIARSSPLREAVPIGSATMQCYSSFIKAAVDFQEQPNQIVMYRQRKKYEPVEMPLRSALTDPLTGALMDDATILLCGHSFGSESLQRVLENNACISCGAAARREDMAPNHALQLVVQAYKREEQRWKENASRAAKRRRERLEQDRQNMGEMIPFDFSRQKGVQFPYKVNDKVLIKGNKRTPERFVGRNAIITMQCLNGWYVVKTLDNGESVKLQYRSLTKTEEQESQPDVAAANWL